MRAWQQRSGLIPAHAGKTSRSAAPARRRAAHPRSRGENNLKKLETDFGSGSSPLTRGKPEAARARGLRLGLIPAHAGKTNSSHILLLTFRAHPRSRGENAGGALKEIPTDGSSPLTRGKRCPLLVRQGRERLIPAHAGKTPPSGPCRARARAHPRSRGENRAGPASGRGTPGSSPLTRGKLSAHAHLRPGCGLIPAHAGKTFRDRHFSLTFRAHPRSRGENVSGSYPATWQLGSSPLTRGKRQLRRLDSDHRRLIPAHAGKTGRRRRKNKARRAHPRSRGENHCNLSETVRGPRLIPAHAGKTAPSPSVISRARAHPRSRGENITGALGVISGVGSSPLTRGKLARGLSRGDR